MTMLADIAPSPADPTTPIFNRLVADYATAELRAAAEEHRAAVNDRVPPIPMPDWSDVQVPRTMLGVDIAADPDDTVVTVVNAPTPDGGTQSFEVPRLDIFQMFVQGPRSLPEPTLPVAEEPIAEPFTGHEPIPQGIDRDDVRTDTSTPFPIVDWHLPRRDVSWYRDMAGYRAGHVQMRASAEGLFLHDDLVGWFHAAESPIAMTGYIVDRDTLSDLLHTLSLGWSVVESLRTGSGDHWPLVTHEEGVKIPPLDTIAPPVVDTPLSAPPGILGVDDPAADVPPSARVITLDGVARAADLDPEPDASMDVLPPLVRHMMTHREPLEVRLLDPDETDDLLARARAAAAAADAHDEAEDRKAGMTRIEVLT